MANDDINSVIDVIKHAGCSGRFNGLRNQHVISDIPDWQTYTLVRKWQKHLYAIALTKYVFNKPKAIEYSKQDSKCAYCTKLGKRQCPYGLSQKIPAGTFFKGCEHWRENTAVYF